jgi:large subunit ribosomal protein L13
MKTYSAKKADVQRQWVMVDAEDMVLGRLASHIAHVLRGKNKPTFTPHVDTGDFVVVVNAEKVRLTGNKLDGKIYYRHSGYPGGIKSMTARELLGWKRNLNSLSGKPLRECCQKTDSVGRCTAS